MLQIAGFRRAYYFLLIKTPIVALIVLFMSLSSLIIIGSNNYKNTYVYAKGTVNENIVLHAGNNIDAAFDEQYYDKVKIGEQIKWHTEDNKYYSNASIVEKAKIGHGKMHVTLKLSDKDLGSKLSGVSINQGRKIIVQLLERKERIISWIFRGKQEVSYENH